MWDIPDRQVGDRVRVMDTLTARNLGIADERGTISEMLDDGKVSIVTADGRKIVAPLSTISGA